MGRRKKKTRYTYRFPDKPVWNVGILRALNAEDELRRCAVVLRPGVRHYLEIDPYLPTERVVDEAARLLAAYYRSLPWWSLPERIQCDDEALEAALEDVMPSDVWVARVDGILELQRAQDVYEECCNGEKIPKVEVLSAA